MLKKLAIILFFIPFALGVKSQCVLETVVIDSIIDCDEPAGILLSGFADGVLIEDFNIGGPGPGWTATSSAQYDNPCDPSPDGTTYMWMGPSSSVPRILESDPFDMSGGARICFDLDMATQTDGSPCEGPDQPDEGVFLQYSTDGGATWENIYYFNPDTVCCGCPAGGCGGTAPSPFISWDRYCFDLPPGGWSSSTSIRWLQDVDSGAGFDHWGIDNIEILTADTNYTAFESDGDTVLIGDTLFYSPTSDSTYSFYYTNGIDDTCTASALIEVRPTDAGPDSVFACPGTGVTLNATGALNVAWSPNIWIDDTTLLSPTVTPPRDTSYVVTSNCGQDSIDVVFVEIKAISNDTLICDGSGTPFDLFVEFYTDPSRSLSYTWVNTTLGGFTYITPFSSATTATPTVAPLATSAFRVQISDGVCPNINDTVLVEVSPPITVLDTLLTPATCPSDSNGSIALHLDDGVRPFEYSIDTGTTWQASDSLFSGLVGGTYQINYRDSLGCNGSVEVVLPGPLPFTVDSVVTVDVTCGGANGEIEVFLSDAATPYSYFLDGVPTAGPSFTGLSAGTYSVAFEDANGCRDSIEVVVSETAPFLLVLDLNDSTSCFNSSDGVLGVDASAGATPFEYRINGGPWGSVDTFPGLASGPYLIEVRDALGCLGSIRDTIGAPPAILFSVASTDSVLCSGGNDGRIDVTASGGSPGYQFGLVGGTLGVDSFFTSLTSGSYNIAVVDTNGCSDTLTADVFEPAPLVTNLVNTDSTSCFGLSDGEIEVSATGGTTPYQFAIAGNPFQASGLFTGLAEGSYDMVSQDANGCVDTLSVVISQPDSVEITSVVVDSVSCFGFDDGQIAVTATGGTPTYQYSYGGSAFTNAASIDTIAGNYLVIVQDVNGCADSATVDVFEPAAIQLDIVRVDSVSCFGITDGEIEAVATDGTRPYEFELDGGGFGPDSLFTGLASGLHTVTVRDANGCTISRDTTVLSPPEIILSVTNIDSVLCFGGNGGRIDVTASGGNPGYQYGLVGGGLSTDSFFTTLSSGTYTIVAVDAEGCSDTVVADIFEPAALNIVSGVQDSVNCHDGADGSVQLSISGGTLPYVFTEDGFVTTQSDSLFSGLTAGNYTFEVEDDNNCGPESITLDVFEPDTLEIVSVATLNISCFGGNDGEITITPSGGTPPYQYSLDGVSFQASSTFTGLTAGTYNLFVSDANGTSAGCLATGDTLLTEPTDVTLVVSSFTNVSCPSGSDGEIEVQASGGVPPYEFSIDGGSTWVTDSLFTSLTAGGYNVQVRDDNLCTEIVSQNITEPDAFGFSASVTEPSCFGFSDGEIQIDTVFGGTAPYNIQLDGGPAVVYNDNFVYSGLAENIAGYTITITDDNNCSFNETVSLTQPEEFVITSVDTTRVSCFGDSDGTIEVSLGGGTPPYDYALVNSSGDTTRTADGNFNNLAADSNYTVVVTDANGLYHYTAGSYFLS